MRIEDLTTPFEKKRIITYGSDRCKAVYHYVSVQQVTGSLYKNATEIVSWGYEECRVYICFPDCPGLDIGFLHHFNDKTVAELQAKCSEAFLDTPERFIELLERQVTEEKHIGNAQIELAKYLAPQNVERYIAARQAYRDKIDQKHAAEAAKRQAEQEEKERRAKQEKDEQRAALLGWGDTMSELRLGQVLTVLSMRYRYDGTVKTRQQHIIDSIAAGYRPVRIDNVVSYYGSRWDVKESKPRTEYRIIRDNLAYSITKTEYDFATYLYTKRAESA